VGENKQGAGSPGLFFSLYLNSCFYRQLKKNLGRRLPTTRAAYFRERVHHKEKKETTHFATVRKRKGRG